MPDSSPLVSVVILCYKHSQFVEVCLSSLLNQTYNNWELIIADDASPDNSVNVIEDWLRKNNVSAKKNYHVENIGLCRTLNECIELCEGEYIKLIAADDLMLPELLEKSVAQLNKLGPTYGACYSRARYFDEHGVGEELHRMSELPHGSVFKALMANNFITTLTVLLRKDAVREIGGFSLEFLVEDYNYWLEIAAKYQIAAIDEVLAHYRIHANNTSNTIRLEDEVLRIQIHHDKSGDFNKVIENKIRPLYYNKIISEKLQNKYAQYRYRYKWLSFCINHRFPYPVFRAIDKITHL